MTTEVKRQSPAKMGVQVKQELQAETRSCNDGSPGKPTEQDHFAAGFSQVLDEPNQKNPYLPWAESEDRMIRKVINELHVANGGNPDDGSVPEMKSISWVKVSNRIPGRSPKQCRERWRNALNPSINHCPWTINEDMFLLNAQRDYGNKWVKIASQLRGRTENGVKTRYKSIMRAKKRAWKKNEDSQLMSMYNHIGANWKEIANSLPGRSVNGVKLRYRQLLSGTSNEPEVGAPEQALKFFYTCYGNSGSMHYSQESYRAVTTGVLYSSSENTNSCSTNRVSSAGLLPVSSLDTIHPCKSRKRKGTRATLLDKLEKERTGPRSKFPDIMAALLAKVPEETDCEGVEMPPYPQEESDLFLPTVLDLPGSFENKPEQSKLAQF